jgi:hypothetical protein
MLRRNELPSLEPRHYVQFYFDDETLARRVSEYLEEGLGLGQAVLVIATPAHAEAFTAGLERRGIRCPDEIRKARLTFLDAADTLSRFMVEGQPDWVRFEAVIGSAVDEIRSRSGTHGLRAYGEMVDLLWNSGKLSAALRLEEFWGRIIERHGFALYCAYAVNLFEENLEAPSVEAVARKHTHLLGSGPNGALEEALDQAMRDVLGPARVSAIKGLACASQQPRVVMPGPESTVFWLRNNLPAHSDEILALARALYQGAQR